MNYEHGGVVDMKDDRGLTGRIFSVMRKREDLPEMTLPLAVLLIVGVALFSSAGAKLASPVADSEALYFESQNLAGIAACMPFLHLAVCLYALIILLWRRFASLLATPVAIAIMLAFGAELFTTVIISVAMLLVSYVYATSLIAGENRFRRLTSLSVTIATCLLLASIAWIGLNFYSFSDFINAYMQEIPELIGQIYSSYMGTANMTSAELPSFYLEKMARELLVMCPAYLGMLSIAFAWFVDFITCTAFRILDCEDVFIEITHRITLPFSYALVYAVVFVLSLLTSAKYNPMLYVMLRSVLYVMLLPCAAVGVSVIMQRLEDRLYYMTREKLLAFIIIVLALAFFGIFPFLLITSALGACVVIKNRIAEMPHDDAA